MMAFKVRPWIATALSAIAVLVFLWLGSLGAGGAADDSTGTSGPSAERGDIGKSEFMHDVERRLRDDDASIATSENRFLADLAAGCRKDPGGGAVSVAWRSDGDVVEVSSRIVERYRDEESSSSVVASGYLDMSGNAWGALLWDGESWADVVLVTQSDVEQGTAIRVVRMVAAEGG